VWVFKVAVLVHFDYQTILHFADVAIGVVEGIIQFSCLLHPVHPVTAVQYCDRILDCFQREVVVRLQGSLRLQGWSQWEMRGIHTLHLTR
jgi:hypothetical protein